MTYAKGTTVPVERSRDEIQKILKRYGAEKFAYYEDAERSVIEFVAKHRHIRFHLPTPLFEDHTKTPSGKDRSQADAMKAWETSCRERWRALVIAVKAKLEAVESGITTFEDEFLAYIVLPSKQTVSQWLQPQIQLAIERQGMPPMLALPAPDEDEE